MSWLTKNFRTAVSVFWEIHSRIHGISQLAAITTVLIGLTFIRNQSKFFKEYFLTVIQHWDNIFPKMFFEICGTFRYLQSNHVSSMYPICTKEWLVHCFYIYHQVTIILQCIFFRQFSTSHVMIRPKSFFRFLDWQIFTVKSCLQSKPNTWKSAGYVNRFTFIFNENKFHNEYFFEIIWDSCDESPKMFFDIFWDLSIFQILQWTHVGTMLKSE